MKLVFTLLFPLFLFASKYTPNQISTIQYAFNYCSHADLGYSCAAIAYKESDAGIYQISTDYSDFGIMQINLRNHLRKLGLPNTPWNRSRISTKLITDFDYSLDIAIHELQFWLDYHNNNYTLAWGSYNGGTSPNLSYGYSIGNTIRQLIADKVIPRP